MSSVLNTSGTYDFAPSMGETVLYAYGMAGVKRTALTQSHFEDARMATGLMLGRWSADGVNLWQVDLQTITLVQGQATYQVPANTIVMLDTYYSMNTGTAVIDRIMMPVSRTEYASYTNKTSQGRPTVFWMNRLLSPTVTVWPTPDAQVAALKYYRLRQTQDANFSNGQNVEIPYYFLEAYALGLAYRLALIWNQDRVPVLKPLADEAWGIASKQNTETATVFVSPMLGGYFR
jgi:hypothetical protein